MENIPKRIFIDMDGVLCDFHQGVSEMLGRPLTSDDFGHSEYDERKEELTNKRLFAKLKDKIQANIDVTSPENFKGITPVVTHKQLLKVSKVLEK